MKLYKLFETSSPARLITLTNLEKTIYFYKHQKYSKKQIKCSKISNLYFEDVKASLSILWVK